MNLLFGLLSLVGLPLQGSTSTPPAPSTPTLQVVSHPASAEALQLRVRGRVGERVLVRVDPLQARNRRGSES